MRWAHSKYMECPCLTTWSRNTQAERSSHCRGGLGALGDSCSDSGASSWLWQFHSSEALPVWSEESHCRWHWCTHVGCGSRSRSPRSTAQVGGSTGFLGSWEWDSLGFSLQLDSMLLLTLVLKSASSSLSNKAKIQIEMWGWSCSY